VNGHEVTAGVLNIVDDALLVGSLFGVIGEFDGGDVVGEGRHGSDNAVLGGLA
jgi:hypothetical protein